MKPSKDKSFKKTCYTVHETWDGGNGSPLSTITTYSIQPRQDKLEWLQGKFLTVLLWPKQNQRLKSHGTSVHVLQKMGFWLMNVNWGAKLLHFYQFKITFPTQRVFTFCTQLLLFFTFLTVFDHVYFCRAVGTFARALDCSSSVRQPSLHMSAAAASRDITLVCWTHTHTHSPCSTWLWLKS